MRGHALVEALCLVACVACRGEPARDEAPLPEPPARRASDFVCHEDTCRQVQPRLPDSGEWRCAERERVVWCAGGEPAAGVAPGRPDPQFRCGKRWGARATPGERVCIDPRPDYPNDAPGDYACRYEQERGVVRACRREPNPARPWAHERALPACFFDADCPSGRCDRGACRCAGAAECALGSCESGVCAEAAP